jgi:ABC-type branched-subunit amino acid transport system ATPase component
VSGAAGTSADSARPGDATARVALEVSDVRAGYGDVEVLRGVSLAVRSGQVVALIGANGAGKSTLCSVVTGLVPASSGSVGLGGDDVTALAPHRRVRHGAFLIPEGRGVFPALTVEENLSLWLASEPEREEAYVRFPALADRRRHLAGSLSGGEQQMLALAPALVRPPTLLVVDEPSLGLAPLIVADVYRALHELRDRGTAILLVEEKAHDVLALADTVAFMSAGRVAWERPTSEVDSDLLVQSYLGIADASGAAEGSGEPGEPKRLQSVALDPAEGEAIEAIEAIGRTHRSQLKRTTTDTTTDTTTERIIR